MTTDESALKRIYRILEGRFLLLVLAILVLGGGGAYLGWTSKAPLYRATRMIEARPGTDGGSQLRYGISGYIATQVSLLRSPRLTDLSLADPRWVETGLGSTPAGRMRFDEGRSVEHIPGTWTITVSFIDPAPRIAECGVDALVRTFEKYTSESDTIRKRVQQLVSKETNAKTRIKSANERIDELTKGYGSISGLEVAVSGVNDTLVKAENLRGEAKEALAAFGEIGKAPAKPPNDQYVPLTKDQIAPKERDLRKLILARGQLDLRRSQLADRGSNDPDLLETDNEIRSVELQIRQFVDTWNHARKEAEQLAREAAFEQAKQRYEAHVAEHTRLTSKVSRIEAWVKTLESKRGTLSQNLASALGQRREIEEARVEWESIRGPLRRARAEQEAGGHLVFPQIEDVPARARPFKDPRKTFGAALGLLGALVGAGIVLLLALRDRRLKGATDVEHALKSVRMLGFLPTLPSGMGATEDGEIAAHSAHQIRTILQVRHARQPHACLCISGPNAACGKTTVTKALGLSYASSGARTLMIDADFTGRGLTRTVAHMLLGSLREDVRAGLARSEQTEYATTTTLAPLVPDPPPGTHLDPDEILAEFKRILQQDGLLSAFDSGSVDSAFALADLIGSSLRSRLASALDAAKQAEGSDGSLSWASAPARRASIDPNNLNGSMPPVDQLVYRTGTRNLRFLPLAGLGRAGSVSAASIQRVLERVRTEFDVVLIDTGPVRGSVETSMVAAYADSAVLVVSPGDDRETAERAVAHLNDIEARIAGVVLNRANAREIEASTSFSIVRSRNQEL